MKKNTLFLFLSFVVCSTLSPLVLKAQNNLTSEQIENFNPEWKKALMHTRATMGALKEDFSAFVRFNNNALHIMQGDARAKVRKANFEPEQVSVIMKEAEKNIGLLYQKFLNSKKQYPSSVEEYSLPSKLSSNSQSCDSTGCTNIGFEEGTLNSWYGYYAENSSSTVSVIIAGVNGGILGAVTQAAQDPNISPSDYQLWITSSGYDNIVHTIPRVSPWGGSHSVMLGDSTEPLQGVAILSKTFYVTAAIANLTYQYAVFLENPGHTPTQQPFFNVSILDANGDTIPNCGSYNVVSGFGIKGYDSINYEGTKVYYRDWTIVNVPLKNYVGQCVTITFESADCALGGHFGYAYVDATCSPLGLISSSPAFCGQDSISLTAPPGAQSYAWTGPTNGILSDTTKQTIWVDSAGNYTVITVPVTGAKCADTISIHINKIPGPPPHPSFTADTVCAGKPMQFINTSDSTKGVFSWDFYNLGVYNISDTNNFNPTWTYINPGIYTVKLHEVLSNGCGADTLINVVVDTNVTNPTFTAAPTCVGDTTYFTPNAAGASLYDWNFGDPTSLAHDSSKLKIPGHLFTGPGTYTVTFTANNQGGCGAVNTQVITIYAAPTPNIRGMDTICPGTKDTLFASGGTSYLWNNTYTKTFLAAAPTVTTTYTLEAYNGTCSKDTTFTITVVPPPTPSVLASKDSVCKGDTLTLWGSGGTTYKWGNGSTKSTLHVTLDSTTTFKLYEFGGACKDSISIKIPMIPAITATFNQQFDSICPGTSVLLSATGAGGQVMGYKWNTGATTSSITVVPTSDTSFTSTVYGICDSVKKTLTIKLDPLPVPKITGPAWECKGIPATLTVSSSSNPTKYVWSNGKTTTTITTTGITANTTYTVYATNSLGCSDSTTYTVDLRDAPGINITPPALACAGNSVTLIATGSGQGPFTYTWEPGGATTDSISVNPTTKTTYTVTVSNGCNSTKTTIVTPDSPTLSACCDKTILIGEDTTIVAGGPKMRSYSWAPDSGFVCLNPPLCDSIKVTPTVTTTYTVTGTDSLGCQVERLVTITIEIPCFSLNIPNVFTPDNKGSLGLDNIFYIKTENINGWSLIIFDRWGKEMYNSTNPNEFWTGTNKGGANAPDGVYYYIVTGTCQGTTYKKDGFVQLIR